MPRVKADLHIHSCYSDGESSPEEILIEAAEKGLGAVSVTDHNTFKGSLEALRIAKEKNIDIIVIPGAEVRTDLGDVLVYCRDPANVHPNISAEALLDIAEERGCIAVPAHPFDTVRAGMGNSGLKKILKRITAIECFNAFSSSLSNRKAYDFATMNGLGCFANSDAHTIKAIGQFYTILEIDPTNPLDFLRNSIAAKKLEPVARKIDLAIYIDKLRWSLERRISKRKSKCL